jgi:anti-sigma-K factor RskA
LIHDRVTEDVRELAALYALGSLTQHEARSFEVHIKEGCAACEAELRRFERTVAGIGFASDEVKAPDSIRDRLMARIEKEPQSSGATATPVQEKKIESPKREPSRPPKTSSVLFNSQQRDSSGYLWLYVAAFAALVILGITLYSLYSARETNAELEASLNEAKADLSDLNILLDSQKEKTARLEQIPSLIEKPDMRIARLVELIPGGSSLGAVLWDPGQNQCLLLGSLPPAPPGKVYQLWFVRAASQVPAGTIHADPMGRIFMELSVPETAIGAQSAVITTEPENGSQVPTKPYYAAGRFN